MVAVPHRAGAERGQVGAGARFGEELAPDLLAGPQQTQKALSQFRGAESQDRQRGQHRQRSREDDERLLLQGVVVAAPLRAGLVAPEVGAGVGETGPFAQLGDVARRLSRLVRAGDPLELVGTDHTKAHDDSLVTED